MALDTKQIAGLNALNQKIAGGYQATAQDTANLNYAKSKGYTYTPMAEGSTKISNVAGLQGLNESQLYRSGQDIYRLPEIPTSLSSSDVTETSIKPVEPEPNTYDSMIKGLDTTNKGVEANVKSILAPLPQEKELNAVQQRIKEETEANKTAGRDLQEEQRAKYGLDKNVEEVQKLMPQIAKVQADYMSVQEQIANQPISSRIIGGIQDRLQRQKAVELAGLSAVAQAYQGNVDLARQISQDAVNAQFQDQQNYNEGLKTQLDYIYKDLDREEKKQANALKLIIAERERSIETEKQNRQGIFDIALTASEKSVSSEVATKILNAKTPEQAMKIAFENGVYQQISTSDLTPKKIGSHNGNDIFFDPVSKSIKTAKELLKTDLGDKGIVSNSGNAYDMSTYATDPKHSQSVQKRLDEIGKFNSVEDIDAYIKSKYPNSPITGQMVANSAAKYGIGWEEIVALAQHESYLGTSNVAKSNNNLGGVTWNANFPADWKGTARQASEGGNYVKFPTLQDGVNSMAYELAKRKVDISQETEDISDRAKLVLDNPALLSNYTNTEKGKIIDELAGAGVDTSPLEITAIGNTAIKDISQSKDALDSLADLSSKINNNLQYIGPVKGLAAINPWSKARKIQADIDRIRQTVGKALEGGVLRKEDEEKYKKILATITDTPETAQYKITQLIDDIRSNIVNYGKGLGLSENYINNKLLGTSEFEKNLLNDNNIEEATGVTSSGVSYTIE